MHNHLLLHCPASVLRREVVQQTSLSDTSMQHKAHFDMCCFLRCLPSVFGLSVCTCMQVTAVAYDNPIPGFHTNNTINLRLWAAKPDREFDLEAFNTGDYVQVLLMLFQLNDLYKGQFLNR